MEIQNLKSKQADWIHKELNQVCESNDIEDIKKTLYSLDSKLYSSHYQNNIQKEELENSASIAQSKEWIEKEDVESNFERVKKEEFVEMQENKQQKYDTQNKIEEIKLQIDVLSDLSKKFPSKPDQFEKRIIDSYDTNLRIALDYAINALDVVQLFLDSPLKKMTSNRHDTVLNSISVNIKEIALHLSIYDSFYLPTKQSSIKDIIYNLNQVLDFMENAETKGLLLTSSSAEANHDEFNDKALQNNDNQDLNSRKSVAKERVESSNIDELKEILSRSLYNAQSGTLELREIVKSSNHNILDEVDYQKEYIKLLNTLTNIVSRHQENDTLGSLLLVARYLHDPDYLSNWLKNAKKDERVTIIGNYEGGQQEFVEPNILKNISPEPIDSCDKIPSNYLKIEDIPLEYRSCDVYILSLRYAREQSIERYVEICHILFNDIEGFGDKSAMTKREKIELLGISLNYGFEFFNENKALVNFVVENQEALDDLGILHELNYSSNFSKEKIRTVENQESDFFFKKSKVILSKKEEVKLLSFMIRQVGRFKRHGYPFVMFHNNNSKIFKKQQQAYEYLVGHLDEIKQSPNVYDVAVTKTNITIYFERN